MAWEYNEILNLTLLNENLQKEIYLLRPDQIMTSHNLPTPLWMKTKNENVQKKEEYFPSSSLYSTQHHTLAQTQHPFYFPIPSHFSYPPNCPSCSPPNYLLIIPHTMIDEVYGWRRRNRRIWISGYYLPRLQTRTELLTIARTLRVWEWDTYPYKL